MRITSKGQVTIPKTVRDKLGLLPNSDVQIEVVGKEARIRRSGVGSRGADVIARLKGSGTVRMTTDQIMALTRG